jgi:hypothetical protein
VATPGSSTASRRGVYSGLAVPRSTDDTAFFQRREHAVEQRLRQPGQGLDRQFFGAEFDQ